MKKLKGERIFLRPFELDDADAVTKVCSQERVTQYLPLPYPYTHEDAESWIKSLNDDDMAFAVCKKDDGQVIGSIGLTINRQKNRAMAGYWLAPEMWGQGITTEGVKLVFKYAFEELKLDKITAWHCVENIASGKVMRKCGMRFVGLLERNTKYRGKCQDDFYYEILNPNLKSQN